MTLAVSGIQPNLRLVVDNSAKTLVVFSETRWKKLMFSGHESFGSEKYSLARFYYDRANREAVNALDCFAVEDPASVQELYTRASAHAIAAENLANIHFRTGYRQLTVSVLTGAFERLLSMALNQGLGMAYREVLIECLTVMLDGMMRILRACGCCAVTIHEFLDRAGQAAIQLSQGR
ncbi:hypothetical protein [Emcibacter sp.]|uniref:hypothetical protein n=1 Tax=Emcibacter sp. TaxID=1979954 RepID=UPI003A908348